MDKLPIYDITIDDLDPKQGVAFISLVTDPAINVNWIKLSKEKPIHFSADVEKKMLYGPFLIPNMLIYRVSDDMEYYVRFSKDEIEKISMKFNGDLNSKNLNFQHSEKIVDGFVAENWLVDEDNDKSKKYGFDLPSGTWFGGVKIKDSDFWDEYVKTDEVMGFSVELLSDMKLVLKNNNKQMKRKLKFESATLVDGTTVYWSGELAVGTGIWLDDEMTVPAPDGEHTVEGGTIVVTAEGVVVEIRDVEQPEVSELEDEIPTASGITADEVSQMIDVRFGDIMEEITRLKIMIEEVTGEMVGFKKEVNDKFSSTPGAEPVKKSNIDGKFLKIEERIKSFAKIKI